MIAKSGRDGKKYSLVEVEFYSLKYSRIRICHEKFDVVVDLGIGIKGR